MNKGRLYREQVLDQAFFSAPVSWVTTAGHFLVSLHTAVPEDAEGRLVAEVRYPDYAAVRIGRDRQSWRRSGNVVVNHAEVRFARYLSGPAIVVPYWAITAAGAGAPTWFGKFDRPMEIISGSRPVLDAGMIELSEW